LARARRAHLGGIRGLHRLLTEHGEAIESDLHRFYGRDLRDLTTGRLTWRQLKVLLAGLPADAATRRSIGGPEEDWHLEHHLLALIIDGLREANWQRANQFSKHPSRPPTPLPRPGVVRRALGRTSMTSAQVKAFLARFNPPEEVAAGDD
jgi:hypothetical protein